MDAIDSPSQPDVEIEKNTNSIHESQGEEDNCINDSQANKELGCHEDDKVLHQNNMNSELQQQKLILYNNFEDEALKEQNPISYSKKSCDISYTLKEEQESCASPKDGSVIEKQNILDDQAVDLRVDNSCNKEVTDTENKIEHYSENADSSFHTNLSETPFETCESDARKSDSFKAFQSNAVEGDNVKPILDYFPLNQTCIAAEEEATMLKKYENEAEGQTSKLKINFQESAEHDTELQICSPKINGNHKDEHDTTYDLPEGDIPVERGLEIEEGGSESEAVEIKGSELQKNITYDIENPFTKATTETRIEQNEKRELLLDLNKNESRCATPDSISSSSTTHSSSSQQLVIDQPTDEEKVSPLRITIKTKKGKTIAKKQTLPKKKSNAGNRKLAISKSSIFNLSQNGTEHERSNVQDMQFSKTETETQSIFTLCSSSNEPKDVNDMDVDAVMLPQEFPVAQTEQLVEKLTVLLPCDCNKTNVDSSSLVNSHLHTCPSYKATAPNYYKCTSCGTYHENWSFFLHIREQHDRFLCLYCIKCFPTAEKLSLHLEIKHDLEQNHFNSEESFRSSATVFNGYALETRFLMCCTCQHVFGERMAFSEHVCMEYMKSCVLCGQKGRHSSQCKAHPFVKRRNKKKVKEKRSLQAVPTTSELMTNVQDETSTQCQSITVKPKEFNEDSNSSSNMVIDESCTTNHSLSGKINAFNAAEEPGSVEQLFETQQESLPKLSLGEPDNTNTNFLKFKLRVPKEFQKPVDAIISSSESDGAYEEDVVDESNQQNASDFVVSAQNLDSTNLDESKPEQLCHNESNESTTSAYGEKLSKTECDEESGDEEDTNPYLARILEEIEQTKLDIQRTKETIHHHHSHKADMAPKKVEHSNTYSQEHIEENNSVCLQPVEGSPKRNWTPTPPASPKVIESESSMQDEHKAHETTMEVNKFEDSKVKAFNGVTNSENSLTEMQSDQPHDPTENLQNLDNIDNSEDNEPNDNDINQNQRAEENQIPLSEPISEIQHPPPSDGIEIANEDCLLIELQLDRPIEKYEIVEFVRTCLKAAYPYCLYCNHARRIAVNGESLVLHLIAQHRFSATVDSITAEELQPDTIVGRLKSFLPQLQNEFFNTSSYCTIGAGAFTRHFNERIFECFQCRFVTTTHKELYLHNRKMHLRTAILCFMCRCNFFSFSEILCHICPGVPHKVSIFEIKFRCCLCDLDNIPSPFRLMVHLRKRHFACDICLEDCRDQSKLSSHVWKHKLHHLCYRCGIAYRNKMDITKHLFWKHGTESDICKRCLNKRWPHVYHFCVPPQTFSCEVCQHCFSKAMYLTVHKRIHLADFRYPCTEENCEEKFISRKLLLKHAISHQTLEKADNKDNNSVDDVPTGDADADALNEDRKVEQEDTTMCDANKQQPDHDDETQADQKIKQEPESCLQNQNQEAEETKSVVLNAEDKLTKAPQKKKKKKRAKESLEDLNLTAPNLSESGSSSDSESETKSKYEEESKAVRSPSPENADAKEQKMSEVEELENPGNVLDIWKNFLQAQQASGAEVEASQLDAMEDDVAAPPKALHVAYSDHDYCKLFNTASSKPSKSPQNNGLSKTKKSFSERKRTQSMQRHSSRNSNASNSSSDESSDTSSSSSCSCGPNCSCSPGSSSSSSSSSSENSDSSAASRKRQRKKSDRNSRHRKSESISPRKNHNTSEIINVMETDENTPIQGLSEAVQSADNEKSASLSETFINESDLETAESETDEEYYDEHPQKFANELLSQKRAQLMARTFLSPSHNFDIVENSRPSTPSLPGDVVYEKRKKKKKRDRKSTSKSNILPPKFQIHQAPLHSSNLEASITVNGAQQQQLEAMQGQYLAFGDNLAEVTATSRQQGSAELPVAQQRNISHFGTPRISEGSSCSDVDGSLKRSKRARRPNKFYGYTSDDESMGSAGFGQSLLIGTRTFKPQPPPQLVWNKEDLPTPSKSILNSKKTPRAPKRPEADTNASISTPDYERAHGSLPKKRKTASSSLPGFNRKRSKKLPPIPRLKIRPALFGISNSAKVFKNESLQNSMEYSNEFDNGSHRPAAQDDDDSSDVSSEDGQNQAWNNLTHRPRKPPEHYHASATPQIAAKPALPLVAPPLPPTPQTTVFNHKIPPALLPNPDFATLQYFKANNIRYPIRPPAGARAAREGESVYCYCRCPYDEVSEMIACDGDNCLIEWFHFECVGIMVAPQGKWFCAECRPHYSEDLYPQSAAPNLLGTLRDH